MGTHLMLRLQMDSFFSGTEDEVATGAGDGSSSGAAAQAALRAAQPMRMPSISDTGSYLRCVSCLLVAVYAAVADMSCEASTSRRIRSGACSRRFPLGRSRLLEMSSVCDALASHDRCTCLMDLLHVLKEGDCSQIQDPCRARAAVFAL